MIFIFAIIQYYHRRNHYISSSSGRPKSWRKMSNPFLDEALLAVTSTEEYAAKILAIQQACLKPLKEDLADWLNKIMSTSLITSDNFMHKLDNGVTICRLAKIISVWCLDRLKEIENNEDNRHHERGENQDENDDENDDRQSNDYPTKKPSNQHQQLLSTKLKINQIDHNYHHNESNSTLPSPTKHSTSLSTTMQCDPSASLYSPLITTSDNINKQQLNRTTTGSQQQDYSDNNNLLQRHQLISSTQSRLCLSSTNVSNQFFLPS